MLTFISLFYGFLAILAELVILRELAVIFYGSELFFGTFLSSWFFWVGLGSLSASHILKKGRSARNYFAYGLLAVSSIFPLMILMIRASKGVFAFGEFISPIGMILYVFGIMSTLCLVIGAQFSLACAVASGERDEKSALGYVYTYEAFGAAAGGALFTYALIGNVPTFIMSMALAVCCVITGFFLLSNRLSPRAVLSATLAAFAALAVIFAVEPAINRFEWRGYRFVAQTQTRNDTLSLADMGSIKNIFVDGMLSASFPNPEGDEPAAHLPLLASPAPSPILIIGDASLGVLKEALKHNPGRVDYIMKDGSFLSAARRYLGDEEAGVLDDGRIHIHYGDARTFVKKSKYKYGAVIINIQEVPNLKANRFYTREFYDEVRDILRPDGILVVSALSSENYLSMRTRVFNASVYRTLSSVFKKVEVIPGDIVTLLASPGPIDMREEAILERFKERDIRNHYLIPSLIAYKLEAQRRAELKNLLEETEGARVNTDFRPTTYYYFTGFRHGKFTSPLEHIIPGALIIFFAIYVFKRGRPVLSAISRRETLLIFVVGFTGMSMELVLLLGYEIISGYVYWQVGALFAAFMSGLFLGSLLGRTFKDSSRRICAISLGALSFLIAGLSIAIAYIMPKLIHLSAIQNVLIFMSLLTLVGAIMGSAFVTAGFLVRRDEISRKAGDLYASDLWGSALGALVITNFIVPVSGLIGALYVAAAIGLAGLAIFLMLSRKVAA